MPEDLSSIWEGLVPRPHLEEYAAKYADYFMMTRRDGIIELRMHTNDAPPAFNFAVHNAWGQAWQEVGNDPENHVVIITGTGDEWMTVDTSRISNPGERTADDDAKLYYDSMKLLENLVFALDVPTIAAVNGPARAHTEFALACDITICSEDASFADPHFLMGVAPGDGLGLTFQELLGTKRSAYYLYTGAPISASEALEFGLVNEVLPKGDLLPRAWELAEMIMRRPRNARLMTHAIVSRPWKRRLVEDFGFHLSHEMLGIRADRRDSTVTPVD